MTNQRVVIPAITSVVMFVTVEWHIAGYHYYSGRVEEVVALKKSSYMKKVLLLLVVM